MCKFTQERALAMRHGKRLISAVLAAIMAVSIVLPFSAMPASADDGNLVVLSNTALSNASDFDLEYLETQYGDMMDYMMECLLNCEERINIYSYKLPADLLSDVIYYLEYYKLCYFLDPYDFNYSWDGTYIYQFIPTYIFTPQEIEYDYDYIIEKCDAVVEQASVFQTDVEKLLYLHNYLVDKNTYDTSYNNNYNNAYGAMIIGASMCEGYASCFAYMANKLGIKTYVITSVAIGHAWNMVLLDGYYYHIDCTWDDPTVSTPNLISNPVSGYAKSSNFLCSDSGATDNGHCPDGWDKVSALDWRINGVSVYGIAANSTMYDSFDLKGHDVLSHYSNGSWYYAENAITASATDESQVYFNIKKITFVENNVYVISNNRKIYTCFKTSGGYYSVFYSVLQSAGGNVYYTTASGIYKLVPDGASDGSDDILIMNNTVDRSIFDFRIHPNSTVFTVVYGSTITDYSSSSATTNVYNNADYFCAVEGHNYIADVISPLTHDTDEIVTFTCAMCGTEYTSRTYCIQTMIGFFNAALNSRTGDSNYNAIADVNRDGFVNIRDYALIIDGTYLTIHVHTVVTDAAVAPTCTETGLTEGSHCSECGAIITEQTAIPALGHTWNDGSFTPATASTPGKITYTCTTCGSTKNETATEWQIYGGKVYFYGTNGYPLTGWQTLNGNKYYFDSNGARVTGLTVIDGTGYYFDNSGVMQTGWQTINGSTYYFGSDGAMYLGLKSVGGTYYYFDSSGVMQTNYWYTNGTNKRYFGADGKMYIGKKQIGSYWYFFNSSGVMQYGLQKNSVGDAADNKFYYYDDSTGVMKTNYWKYYSGNKARYFGSDGIMYASCTKTISGKSYTFDSSGYTTKSSS